MAKLNPNSRRTKDLLAHIEDEISKRPTRRVRLLRDFYVVWLDGLHGQVPAVFADLEKDLDDTADPEYGEYLRLRAKFEG